ncbi:MAG TPA: hypothetical protein VNA16_09960 [Abditibacteriaceae bacterium]|nr:hypothetical protein [Abditibacteriaceae bacterium]
MTAQLAHAQNGFTYLDDETEAGGYDITATLQSLPVEMTIAEQENGDAYRLRIMADGAALSAQVKKVARPLVQTRTRISPGLLVAQRRGSRWRVIMGNRVVLEAEDDKWQEGRIGYRGKLKDARVQPVEDVVFDDDFMRVASEVALAGTKADPRAGVKVGDVKTTETIWTATTGGWSTTGLSENEQAQVAQSANPFVFKAGAAGSNLAVAGRPFWSDYAAEVSVKPEGAGAVGLAAYVQDSKNYLLLHWKASGPMQLRAVVNGQTHVLAEAAGGYDQQQWYRLRFAVAGGVLRAYVDDAAVIEARTGWFGRGQVGLYAENATDKAAAVFDDVQVRSLKDFHENFRAGVPGRWRTIAGAWHMQGTAIPADARGAFAVMGDVEWSEYTTSANISLPVDAAAGLMLHHRSGQGAYLLRVAGSKAQLPFAGKAQILKIGGAKPEILAEAQIGTAYDGKTLAWSFSDERGYLEASAGETRIVDAFDESLPAGRAGIYAMRGKQGVPALSSFAIEFPHPRATWGKVPDLYEDARQAETMGVWSTPQGFWSAAAPMAGGAAPVAPVVTPAGSTPTSTTPTGSTPPASAAPDGKIMWHKGAFWGNQTVRFKLPLLAAGQSLTLLFDAVRQAATKPAMLDLTFKVEGGMLAASLARNGVPTPNGQTAPSGQLKIGQLKIEGTGEGQDIEVARRGNFLIVRVGMGEKQRTLLWARVG